MNRILLSIFAAGLCFAVGHALQCYNCDIGLGSLCITTKVTCKAGENCYSGVGKAGGFLDVKMKGCLIVSECNKTTSVNFPSNSNTTVYSMTKTCCDSDLCNSAPGQARVSLLPLSLATLTTLFMAKALV